MLYNTAHIDTNKQGHYQLAVVIRPLPDFSRSPSPSRGEESKQPLDKPLDKPLDTRLLSKNPLRRSASSAVQHSNGSSGMHSSAAASKHKDAVSGSSGSSGRASSSTRKVSFGVRIA
jgi:hypothetical protein